MQALKVLVGQAGAALGMAMVPVQLIHMRLWTWEGYLMGTMIWTSMAAGSKRGNHQLWPPNLQPRLLRRGCQEVQLLVPKPALWAASRKGLMTSSI